MSIAFECRCGKQFKVPDEQSGLLAQCPHCKSEIKIPVKPLFSQQTTEELPIWEPEEVYQNKEASPRIKEVSQSHSTSTKKISKSLKNSSRPTKFSENGGCMNAIGSLLLIIGMLFAFITFLMAENALTSTFYLLFFCLMAQIGAILYVGAQIRIAILKDKE